jgi:hypothetical protein
MKHILTHCQIICYVNSDGQLKALRCYYCCVDTAYVDAGLALMADVDAHVADWLPDLDSRRQNRETLRGE